jgi:hypothetical protein
MKVYIGPYKNNTIFFRLPIIHSIYEYFRSKRKIKVKIDHYDVWNLDHTLSLIILPALIKLKEDKGGVPNVSNEDVPDNLKTTEEYNNDDFDLLLKKWDYVLDEIIFAFKSKQEDWESQFCSGEIDIRWEETDNEHFFQMVRGPKDTFKIDYEGRNKYQERISNGFKLFGKYYESLWT